MSVSPDPQSGKASLLMIEGSLTLVVAAVAFGWPRLGDGFFSRIERAFGRLARRQGLAVFVVGCTALLSRLAILPFCPIPHPFVPDDFSFLLAADTFASGRLTNPTPAMWTHFESFHITMQPTYMSMYFPAQGLVMAAAKVVTGSGSNAANCGAMKGFNRSTKGSDFGWRCSETVVCFGPMITPPSLATTEAAESNIAIVSSADCQSAFSRVNLHEAGPKKNEIRFKGSLTVNPCSDAFPVDIASTSSMCTFHGISASKTP